MKPKYWTILATIVVLSTLVACVAPAPVAAPTQPPVQAPTQPPAQVPEGTKPPEGAAVEQSWFAQAAQDTGCVGKTIRGVAESTPPSRFAADPIAKQFAAETGINVEFETTSWDQMYDKEIKDMEANTGLYDFVYIEQDIVYAYLARNFLVDVTQALKDKPQLHFSGYDPEKFTTFINYYKDPKTGDVMAVPMESFVKPYVYRKDLFEDPEAMAAFQQQYGYPLAPATTFQQYTDIAKFFTQWGKDHNLELWGSTVQGTTGHAASFYEYYETIAPSWGVYNWGINMDNWKACVANGGQMNSDRAKQALEFWVGMLQYAPPESTSSTWDEVAATMAAGRAAQGWVYGENVGWIARDDTRSKVVGNIGVALPPTFEGVIDEAKAGKGYIGYYDGGAYGIPVGSKNQDCALLWLQYYPQEKFQADWAVAGSRIILKSTYDEPKVQELDKITNGYFTLQKDQGYLFGGAPPFPFHADVREVIAPFIWKTLTGEMTASDALDQACAATEADLVKLGYGQ
jgi:multiple sugar transport system substrate-binding protein